MHVHVLLKNNSMSEHVIYIYECVLQSVTYKPIKSHKMFEYKLCTPTYLPGQNFITSS
jgi:hypothetical protein